MEPFIRGNGKEKSNKDMESNSGKMGQDMKVNG